MTALEYLDEHRAPAFAGGFAILLFGALAFILLHGSKPEPVRSPPQITTVIIQPPKPPPPPPPLPQPKTIVQPKMTTPVQKPIPQNQPRPAPAKPAPSAPALGTSLKSNGSSNPFDLAGGGGFGCLGCNGTGTGAGGSYEDAVDGEIRDALQKNPITRNASAGLEVSVWTDANGLVTRVTIDKTSNDAAVDQAVQNQVLRGLQLSPPPPGTQMPITMSLTGEQALQ